MRTAEDNRLIADCLRGRTAAFGELVCKYQDRLYNTVYRLLENPEDARDVVQDAFLNAFQSLERFQGEAQFFTWLYRIAVNSAISLKRKQKAGVRLFLGSTEGQMAETPDRDSDNRPSHDLEKAEEGKKLHQALACLSLEHRAVLIMKDMDGMKYDEIADILQVPVGTVRSRLHRARLELRDILLEKGFEFI